jgi:arylsulfatase A-like enzyme
MLAAAPSCGRTPSEPAEIDLTTFARQRAAGEGASSAPADGPPELIVPPDRPLDLFLRIPAEARLTFTLPAGADPDALAIEAESATGRSPLRSESGDNGERVASLASFGEQVIRLRITNRSAAPLALVRPRVIGLDDAFAPILARPPQPAGGRLNVVVYVVDTLRADRLSAYGYERDTSPRLEELADRNGVVFERAYAAGANTWASVPAIFTSRFPSEFGPDSLTRAGKTLAEVFHEGGYATASFNGNFSLIEEFGFARGFGTYELPRREKPGEPVEVRADVLTNRAVDWIRAHRDRPFFLYIQTMDVHGYDPPAPWRGKYERRSPPQEGPAFEAAKEAMKKLTPEQIEDLKKFDRFNGDRYDEAVAYTDSEFGRLIDALRELGIADRTVVVFTADHGEPLGQRGQFFHGTSLHEELVRVPLVMLLPGQSRSERPDEIVSLMDLAPTLVDLAGLPIPEVFLGRSLLGARTRLRPPSAFGEQPPFALNPKPTYSWYAREGNWTLLMDPNTVALYDVATDPGELKDVSAQNPVVTGYLVEALTQRVPLLHGGAEPAAAEAALTPEARQKRDAALRALGYVQ